MNRLNKTKFYITLHRPNELAQSVAEVAFVGRSNVGKSSVINAMCGIKGLARTSQTPGRTRTINVFTVSKDKWLVDLPGYGFATGPAEERAKWQQMIEGYLGSRENLKSVIVIVDAKVGPTKLDEQMALWLQYNSIPYIIVANKIDKVSMPEMESQRKLAAEKLGCAPEYIHWVSAQKGTGIGELRNAVEKLLKL